MESSSLGTRYFSFPDSLAGFHDVFQVGEIERLRHILIGIVGWQVWCKRDWSNIHCAGDLLIVESWMRPDVDHCNRKSVCSRKPGNNRQRWLAQRTPTLASGRIRKQGRYFRTNLAEEKCCHCARLRQSRKTTINRIPSNVAVPLGCRSHNICLHPKP